MPSVKSAPGDELIAALAQAHDLPFLALSGSSYFVKLNQRMTSSVTGVTARVFLPTLITAADTLLGPIEVEAITETDAAGGAKNVACNISAVQIINCAPTGCVKTYSIGLGPKALGAAVSVLRRSSYAPLRDLVEHIPVCKDGHSPAVLGDASAAYKFKQLENNPKLFVFGEFIDEPDGHLNRLEGSGVLDFNTELNGFNVGGPISKNDGSTSGNRLHFKSSRCMNMQPAQVQRFLKLDLGAADADGGAVRNLGVAGRNVLSVQYKVGADESAHTESISEFDWQLKLDADFSAAGSKAMVPTDAKAELAKKVILGAKLVSSFQSDEVRARFAEQTAKHQAAVKASLTPAAKEAAVQRSLALEASAGLEKSEPDEPEPEPVKRFKNVDGVKVEIDPPLTDEQQEANWLKAVQRMKPAADAGKPLADAWNGYDRVGDKLRADKPVEAGITKKCKEHLLRLLPTVFYLEIASFVLLQPVPPGAKVDLLKEPMTDDDWILEFVSRLRRMDMPTLRHLGVDYLFDPYAGEPSARASLVATQLTALLVKQSLEAYRLFLGEATVVEPAWLALLHYKSFFVVARDVKDVRVSGKKIDTEAFKDTALALQDAGEGFAIEVKRCKVSAGGKLGEGPYEITPGAPTWLFVKLLEYDDTHSGNLSRAGTDVDTMAAAKAAVSVLPAIDKKECTELTKMILGLAGMTKNLHLLQGESSFKRVLCDANLGRIGATPYYTSAESAHKHLMHRRQLVVALLISKGRSDLTLDSGIPMPPAPPAPAPTTAPPATPLGTQTPGQANMQPASGASQ